MDRIFMASGAVVGFLAVAFGAFGAHGLRGKISPELLDVFEVGVRYQMYHGLALLGLGVARLPGTLPSVAGVCFLVGVLVFSGSLYLLSLTGIRWLGAITPIGGVAFLAGWACLAWAALSAKP